MCVHWQCDIGLYLSCEGILLSRWPPLTVFFYPPPTASGAAPFWGEGSHVEEAGFLQIFLNDTLDIVCLCLLLVCCILRFV